MAASGSDTDGVSWTEVAGATTGGAMLIMMGEVGEPFRRLRNATPVPTVAMVVPIADPHTGQSTSAYCFCRVWQYRLPASRSRRGNVPTPLRTVPAWCSCVLPAPLDHLSDQRTPDRCPFHHHLRLQLILPFGLGKTKARLGTNGRGQFVQIRGRSLNRLLAQSCPEAFSVCSCAFSKRPDNPSTQRLSKVFTVPSPLR